MALLRYLNIFTVLFLHTLQGIITCWIPCTAKQRRQMRVYCVHLFSRWILKSMRVTTQYEMTHSQFLPMQGNGRLIVSNHQSIIDVLAIAAFRPAVFITSEEIRETPGVGFLARAGGCVFIERRNRDRLNYDNSQIKELLAQGFDVVLFAEGTTSDGSQLLPFKSGLFNSVKGTKHWVQPLTIQFLTLGGRSIQDSVRDQLFYYGDHRIESHLRFIFTNPPLKLRILIHPLIASHLFSEARELANASRTRIQEFYLPILRQNQTSPETSEFRLA